jgi:hypothetical protein
MNPGAKNTAGKVISAVLKKYVGSSIRLMAEV